MRYAKLIGIALLATLVSVGCGQAPTMNTDISGYGGYKYSKKSSGSDVVQANVISDLNIGHRINQNIDQEQTGQSNRQEIDQRQLAVQIGIAPTATQTGTQTATNTAGDISQSQSAAQAAAIEGDIEDITIVQSNNIGSRRFDSKNKSDSKKKHSYR